MKATKFIIKNFTSDSQYFQDSLVNPKVFLQPDFLKAWKITLSLPKMPHGIVLFQNRVYQATEPYPEEELLLTVLEVADKLRKRFERLKALSDPEFARLMRDPRERIPEKIRVFVWRRDKGQCANCGSQENLEYDHIIPISKGGSNSARNIELLCEICNRLKSDNIQ